MSLKTHSQIATAALATVSFAALMAFSAPAAAQTQVAAVSGSSDQVELVTVTATRRAVDQQKVGVSLTAVTQEQLANLAPHTLQDLNGAAPNVFIGMGTAGPAQSAIFIRGQGYADVEKTQSPPVGVIQDGVFFGNNTGQLLDMFDVCSVEIDRGPQGIFYGKNTTAGLINITRCAPTRGWGAEVSAGYGSYNDEYIRGVFNAPLGENGGIKLSGQWHANDGYYKNDFTGKNAGGSRYVALHAVVDYDLTDWLNVNFSYDHMHDNGGGSPVQFGNVLTANILASMIPPFTLTPAMIWPSYNPTTGSPDGLAPWHVENRLGGDSDRYDNDMYSLTFKAKTPIGDLVSQSAYMDEADLVYQDFDGTCVTAPGCTTVGNPLLAATGGYLETIRDQKYTQFTHEMRLTGTVWDQFDYTAGLFYYQHKITLHQNTNVIVDQYSSEKDDSWSFFGNLDWNVTDEIKLSAGVRNIEESKDFATFYQLFGFLPITPHIKDSRSWSKLITRFNAQWQVTPDTLLYANRSEGFRSGGFSMRGTLSEQSPVSSNCGNPAGCPGNNFLSFQPETNVTWEVGAKNRFFDNALTFNADGFINEISGYQQTEVVVTPGYGSGTNTYVVNFPKVEIKGLEFSADVMVGHWIDALDGLTLSGSLGIQSAKVKNGVVDPREVGVGPGAQAGTLLDVADFTGVTLQRIPANNFTIRGTYVRELGSDSSLTLTAGYSKIAKFSLGNFGTAQDYQPSYDLVDASATLNWNNYYIKVSGKNLANTAYRDQSLPTVFFQGWGAPRTFGVEVGAKF